MKKELRRDRAKVSILPMTEFGLIQITRQRIRQNVQLSFSEACPTCGGGGVVVSKESTVNRIERWIKRFRSETHEFRLLLKVPLFLEEYLLEGTFNRLRRMQIRYLIRIKLEVDNSLAIDDFRFISLKQNKDLTGMYSV
jgi:ribonuclease G